MKARKRVQSPLTVSSYKAVILLLIFDAFEFLFPSRIGRHRASAPAPGRGARRGGAAARAPALRLRRAARLAVALPTLVRRHSRVSGVSTARGARPRVDSVLVISGITYGTTYGFISTRRALETYVSTCLLSHRSVDVRNFGRSRGVVLYAGVSINSDVNQRGRAPGRSVLFRDRTLDFIRPRRSECARRPSPRAAAAARSRASGSRRRRNDAVVGRDQIALY